MEISSLFSEYSLFTLLILSILAFMSGFIDAVVGGGGLIQLPALLVTLPNVSLQLFSERIRLQRSPVLRWQHFNMPGEPDLM